MDDRFQLTGEPLGLGGASEDSPERSLTGFLFPAPAPRDSRSIVGWWEARRLCYNVIVGGAGVLSLGAFSLLMSLPPSAHNLFFAWFPVLVFEALANARYLLGPLAEIAIEKIGRGKVLPAGPALFRMGLTFSVGLAFLPRLIAGMEWAFRILRWIF